MTAPKPLMYRALEWVMTSRDPERTSSQLAELDQWLAADPEHQRAFWEIDAAVDAVASEGLSSPPPASDLTGSVHMDTTLRPESKVDSDVVTLIRTPDQSQSRVHTGQAAPSRTPESFLRKTLEFEREIRASLRRYTLCHADTEDLLQEVYLRLWKYLARPEADDHSVRKVALAVAHNVGLDRSRRAAIDLDADKFEVLASAAINTLDESVNSDAELEVLFKVMEGLPDSSRQILLLANVYGYTRSEIASRLQISEAAVSKGLTEAVRLIAEAPFVDSRRATKPDRLEWVKLHLSSLLRRK
jgi:RNA polymerase sigma-70 factor, ECF subfamily